MNNYSDKKLISDFLAGDEKSLEVLIKRYLKPIYAFAYRRIGDAQEAEDITQEVFVKVWRNLKRFNKEKKFKAWIFSIAKNACIDFLRKSRPALGGKKTLPFSFFEKESGKNALIENLRDKSLPADKLFEFKNIVSFAMEKISLKYRLVLSMYYNDNLNFREIAQELGESINTIKSRHGRGLALLKKFLLESF
jgi:RNA polymerase sigma-70 factor (ECF subfamily)